MTNRLRARKNLRVSNKKMQIVRIVIVIFCIKLNPKIIVTSLLLKVKLILQHAVARFALTAWFLKILN